MFADDVVLVADSAEGLQASLNAAWDFSRKLRFNYNFGKDKSAIMVFGGEKRGERWVLGEREMEIVSDYKHLGVRFVNGRRGRGGRN
jgi:hypothetical protein